MILTRQSSTERTSHLCALPPHDAPATSTPRLASSSLLAQPPSPPLSLLHTHNAACLTISPARGEAMQAASDATDGSMVSVIGLGSDKVQDICDAAAKQSGEPVQVSFFIGFI